MNSVRKSGSVVAITVTTVLLAYGWFAYQDYRYLELVNKPRTAAQAEGQQGAIEGFAAQGQQARSETSETRRVLARQRAILFAFGNDFRDSELPDAVPARYQDYEQARRKATRAAAKEFELRVAAIDWLLVELPSNSTQADLDELVATPSYAQRYREIENATKTSISLAAVADAAYPFVVFVGPRRDSIADPAPISAFSRERQAPPSP